MATIGERVIEWLGLATRADVDAAYMRGVEAGFLDANDEPPSGSLRSFGYRSVSKQLRDFSKGKPADLLATAWALWQSSPIAKRVLTMKRDHIIGRSPAVIVPDDDEGDTAAVVAEFYNRNKLGGRAAEFTLQLFLFGDQCLPAFVRESDGRVTLGYIDPDEIGEVILHPFNKLERWAVIKGSPHDKQSARIYRIIREYDPVLVMGLNGLETAGEELEGYSATAGQVELETWERAMLQGMGKTQYDGDCFFFAVNTVSGATRGVSDLIQVADWIDQADSTLFALGQREEDADFFSWDVTLVGADAIKVEERRREIESRPPTKGGWNVHNDQEIWKLESPNLRQEGSIATFKAMLGLILGGVGYPFHWFGFGDGTNRATALAQGDPTLKSLGHDQGIVRDMFSQVFRFVVDQAVIAGRLPAEARELKPELVLPELAVRDVAAILPLFGPLAVALMTAVEGMLMTLETAAQVWAKALGEFGVDVDPVLELEQVAAEERARVLNQAQDENEELAGRLAEVG